MQLVNGNKGLNSQTGDKKGLFNRAFATPGSESRRSHHGLSQPRALCLCRVHQEIASEQMGHGLSQPFCGHFSPRRVKCFGPPWRPWTCKVGRRKALDDCIKRFSLLCPDLPSSLDCIPAKAVIRVPDLPVDVIVQTMPLDRTVLPRLPRR